MHGTQCRSVQTPNRCLTALHQVRHWELLDDRLLNDLHPLLQASRRQVAVCEPRQAAVAARLARVNEDLDVHQLAMDQRLMVRQF
jgi:hypothetical protein